MKKISSSERTLAFINHRPVDRLPFHPIIMRWAARYTHTPYRDFCLDPQARCRAGLACARDFDIDWVTVMSDPYAEAEAFGLNVEYPEDDLPKEKDGHLTLDQMRELKPYKVSDHARLQNRIKEIATYCEMAGEEFFVVGWIEGPMSAYALLRNASVAALDLLDDPDAVHHAMDVIAESAKPLIKMQIEAGAHCIGVGDAFASQIGRPLYMEFIFEREKQLIEYIHSLGALAKLHICGNTSAIMPDMIKSGANIVDVDHQVPSMADFVGQLGRDQVFSGQSDPVTVIQNGTRKEIEKAVEACLEAASDRCIVSAGCEVPPDTPLENMRAFSATAKI